MAITSLNRKSGVGTTHLCWLMASACFQSELLCDTSKEPGAESLIVGAGFVGAILLPSSARLEPVNVPDDWERSDLHLSLAETLSGIRSNHAFMIFVHRACRSSAMLLLTFHSMCLDSAGGCPMKCTPHPVHFKCDRNGTREL